MIRIHTLIQGSIQTREGLDSLAASAPAALRWVEVTEPTTDETNALVSGFGIHELSIEDALREGHPPKFEDFGDYLFLIARTPTDIQEMTTRKLAVFFSKNVVITLVRADVGILDMFSARASRWPRRYLGSTEQFVHAVVDFMMEGFGRLADALIERVEALEAAALEEPQPGTMTTILDTRGDIARIAQIVRSQRDVCFSLMRAQNPALTKKIRPYLRDVYDHALRVHDLLERAREGVAAARDAYLLTSNNRLSEIMRILTVITTIMMPLSVVSGVFGMNFQDLPGADNPWGFWLTSAGMLLLAVLMLTWFRRREWL